MSSPKSKAIKLILLFGVISLLGDVIYEGARGVNGPYLKILRADAVLVGLIVGLGEFLGYFIRLSSGYFSDKTKAYWAFTVLGYGMIAFVPLLALAGIWQFAALFMIMERLGKAIRSPARDTILSYATKKVGRGFGFGLHEFADQLGAMIGPLIFTWFFVKLGHQVDLAAYQKAYAFMWWPFMLLMLILIMAAVLVTQPEKLEERKENVKEKHLSKIFWQYTMFISITTLGFVSFALAGFHFKTNNLFSDSQIPLLYAVAMGIDGVFALFIGRIYDKIKLKRKNELAGFVVLSVVPIITLFSAVFLFSTEIWLVITGVLLWGVVMSVHETIMRAGIADITAINTRGTAYGVFNFSYGLAVLIGSVTIGFIYEYYPAFLILFLAIIQLIALISYRNFEQTFRAAGCFPARNFL